MCLEFLDLALAFFGWGAAVQVSVGNALLVEMFPDQAEVIDKLAADKGLDIIVDAADMVFFKPAFDLTVEATAAYDKAYPLK